MIEVKPDKRSLRKADKLLKNIPNGSKRAIANATNRALTRGRMVANKGIKETYTIKAGKLKDSFSIKRANFSRLGGKVEVTSPVTRLSDFKFTPKKRTKKQKKVNVTIKKGQQKVISHAYLSTMGNETIIVARVGKDRTPNKILLGPSIAYMAKDTNVSTNVQKEMTNMFNTRLNHEIQRLLNRKV